MKFTLLSINSHNSPIRDGVGVYGKDSFLVEGNDKDFRKTIENLDRLIEFDDINYVIDYKMKDVKFYGEKKELKKLSRKLEDILLFE